MSALKDYLPKRSLAALLITCYLAYYLLLARSGLHTSITSIISASEVQALPRHLLILGLLPIYIACMIFGSALIGVYLGNTVPELINRFTGKAPSEND